MPSVSVIVPLYNKIRYLSDMLDAVLEQTFTDFELIVIDDGSTDGSGEIADHYAAKDDRIKAVHIPNGGVSHARNTGLDLANGKYITFLDSDDTIGMDYLRSLYTCIIENNADFVIGGITKVWPDSEKTIEIKPPYSGKKKTTQILENFVEVQKKTGIYGFCTAKMFSRSILGSTRFDEKLILAEDFDFYLRLYKKAGEICFSENTDYYYLQEADNSPLNVRDEEIDYLSQLSIQIRFAEFLKDMGAFSGKNCEIVEKSISDYAYLTLHYSAKEDFSQRFKVAFDLLSKNEYQLIGDRIRKKVILSLLKNNHQSAAFLLINSYKKAVSLAKQLIRR